MPCSSSCRAKVTPHSVLTVVSSKPVGSSGGRHVLSGLDHGMGLHTLHLIYYYHHKHNVFHSFELLDPSRESLNQILTHYPTVTGRLTRSDDGKWEIKCNDAGVRIIKATVDTTLDEWLRSADASHERHLTAWDDMPPHPHDFQTWSPFRIQINEFEGGGIAIGVSCTHLVGDVTYAASFFKSWTLYHRHLPIRPPSPISNSPILPGNKVKPFYLTRSPTTIIPLASATFKFSGSCIQNSLTHLCPNATPFDFLSALFFTRVSALRPLPLHSLSLCFDTRTLFNSSSCTNAFHFSLLSLQNKLQLGDVAALVHAHLESISNGDLQEGMIDEYYWFESEGGSGGNKYREPTCMYGVELTCMNMEHMIESESESESLLYGAMFHQEEKPVHVSCHVGNVGPQGLVMVMPSPEGGLARNVTVMLPQDDISALCNDQAILHLQPTLMLTPPPPIPSPNSHPI